MSVERSEQELLQWLQEAVAEILDVAPHEVDVDRPLTELGVSSREAVGLVGDLEDLLDRDLDAALLWKTPTVTALARELTGAGQSGAEQSGAEPTGAAAPIDPTSSVADEPIAIIGLGCRLPGADGPDAFWQLLIGGQDAVSQVPEGRWDYFLADPAWKRAARRIGRIGAFLDDVSGFDAEYFGISPREAELMDPQQRMLLEVVVEAMDHAGLRPRDLRGSATGVFVGMSSNEYSHLSTSHPDQVDAWMATGSAFSIAANRISYLFDLRGPSLTVDTACSSSLVAMHQACRSIAAGESDTAFVAGVNLLLSPILAMTFDKAGLLAAEGGCRPFSADASGIARAEGCGVVVLKRLSAALADGDRVLAVVRGTGVNSDGRSNGMTAPNPQAQAALLREVYATAGIEPTTVDYVEAHGTGTLLGDPIEALALGEALGAGREPAHPLVIGSVKSNLGHLEAAAGIAGVIKVVLSMQHDRIPPSIKYTAPNPHIPFEQWRLAVADGERAWPRYGGPAVAGVSGFGFGGTNAHVVLQEFVSADQTQAPVQPSHDVITVPLTGDDLERVQAHAGALASWLSGPAGAEVDLPALAHTLTRRRDRGRRTVVLSARGREQLVAALTAHAAGARPAALPVGSTALELPRPTARPGAVWVFSGLGSHWPGMGRTLLAQHPVFAAAIDELDPLVRRHAGWSLRAALDGSHPVEGVEAVQVATFGIQVALAALWRSVGLEPTAVIGHSMGEISAAVVAGGLSAEDGVRVMTVRSRLIEEYERVGSGGMALVELTSAEFDELASRYPEVTVCVFGAPDQLTIGSPDGEQLTALLREVEAMGRAVFPLPVRGSAHSPSVEVILPRMREQLAGVQPLGPTRVPMYSTSLDDPRGAQTYDVDHWLQNIRRPVRFAQAVAAAAADGHTAFLELAPHPVALPGVRRSAIAAIPALADTLLTVPTMRRNGDDLVTVHAAMLALAEAGLPVDLSDVVASAAVTAVPERAWRHRRFWLEPVTRSTRGDGHPLLGAHVELPDGERHVWRADVGTELIGWLNDHRVFDVPVLPVSAYAEMVLAAGRQVLASGATVGTVQLEDLQIKAMLVLGEHTDVTTTATMSGPGRLQVEVFSRAHGAAVGSPMRLHAVASVRAVPAASAAADHQDAAQAVDLTLAEAGQEIDLYTVMREAGHSYGPAFLGVQQARLGADGVALTRVELPWVVDDDADYDVHPALLDSCLQGLVVSALSLLAEGQDAGEAAIYLPVGIGRARLFGPTGRGGLVQARLRRLDEPGSTGDLSGEVRLLDDEGRLLALVTDVRLRQVQDVELPVAVEDLLVQPHWELAELPVTSTAPQDVRWLLARGDDLVGGPAADSSQLSTLSDELAVLGIGSLEVALDDVVAGLAAPDNSAAGLAVLLPAAAAAADGGDLSGPAVSDVLRKLVGNDPGMPVALIGTGFVADEGGAGRPDHAALRGLVRGSVGGAGAARVALIDAEPAAAAAELLARSLQPVAVRDDEVRWQGSQRLVRRLRRLEVGALGEPFSWRAGGYLVLGDDLPVLQQVLTDLVRRLAGAAEPSRITVLSRVQPEQDQLAALLSLSCDQVQVHVQADASTPLPPVATVLADLDAAGVPLRGVLQLPSRPSDHTVALARLLHEATAGRELDLWVLAVHPAGLWGTPPEHAVDAAWAQALVQWRRAQGLPATAVHWGALDAAQVAEVVGKLGPRHDLVGIDRLPSNLQGDDPYVAALLRGAADDDGGDGGWAGAAGLLRMPPAQARQALADRLLRRVSSVMGHRAEDVDVTAALTSLGVDSLMAMRAKNMVEQDTGIALPVRLVLQGASLTDIEAFLAEELGLQHADAPVLRSSGERADVEARDATERWLVATWHQVTGRRPASVLTPLSELGSDQDAAEVARLALERLERQPSSLRRRAEWPQAQQLVAAASIEAQADLIRDLIENLGGAPVRLLSPGHGDRRPLFLFHPAGGTTSVYFPLVSQLGDQVPVYGMERLEGLDIDQKVATYIEEIQQIQPEGPYRLGGWSFGGALAYRTAQRLRAMGETVETVYLIDTILAHEHEGDEAEMLAGRFERFLEYLQDTYEIQLDVDVQALVQLPEEEQIGTLMRLVEESGAQLSPALMEHQRTSYEDARMAERYQPSAYGEGRVVLYRSSERGLTTSLDPRYARTEDTLGWEVFIDSLEVVPVPGNHTTLIDRPAVDVMAEHLAEDLAHLDARVDEGVAPHA